MSVTSAGSAPTMASRSSATSSADNERVGFDFRTVLALAAAVVTVALWATAFALHRVDRAVTLRGLRNGVLVALVLFALTFVVETLLFDPGLGVLAGLLVAGGYLWLGTTLIPIGLLVGSKRAWTTMGAWAAVPIIVMSAGFGYAAYRAVQQDTTSSVAENGTFSLDLSGARLGSVTINGGASCQLDNRGGLRLEAGAGSGTSTLATSDGRSVSIGYAMDSDGTNASFTVSVGPITAIPGEGWAPSPETIEVSPTSTPRAGQATLAAIVPLTVSGTPDRTERWSGSFSWTCSAYALSAGR